MPLFPCMSFRLLRVVAHSYTGSGSIARLCCVVFGHWCLCSAGLGWGRGAGPHDVRYMLIVPFLHALDTARWSKLTGCAAQEETRVCLGNRYNPERS